jgi:hypothetical protein
MQYLLPVLEKIAKMESRAAAEWATRAVVENLTAVEVAGAG